MNRRTKILLADDHLVVRMGLTAIIGLEKDLVVAEEASDGEEAVRLAIDLKPDVIIMDLMMPKLNGAEATREILKANPSSRILVLTTFSSSEELRDALDAGAIGALIKDSSHEELISAIRRTARGESTISPEIRHQIQSIPPDPELTPRQIEILGYVAKGLTNAEIAPLVNIGPDCVKAHLKTAFIRLGATTRAEAIAIALQKRLLRI